MKMKELICALIALVIVLGGCSKNRIPSPVLKPEPTVDTSDTSYPGVPKSTIYEVTIIHGNNREKLTVFQSTCPQYQAGYMDMIANDQFPLDLFKGRSISWVNFSFSGSVTVEVKVLDATKVPVTGDVKILPSRYGITPTVDGNVIRFTMNQPGQCSVEAGVNGYKNGLMIFANPPETDIPDTTSGNVVVLHHTTQNEINMVPAQYSGIYFKSGVHDIGVYHVPANIKNIYFEAGSWVYGALILDGNPNVKIWGRGVLSSAKLKYRESHCIEAVNGSNNLDLEGIVIADTKYFSVRLISSGDKVKWVKVIGGWTYNTDGIRVGPNSSVSHCFVWANDDNIKAYRNDIIFSDIVCWQLNNGGIIQLSWGSGNATNVTISRVDVLHAEWNSDATNRGVLSCVGDKFATGGMYGLQKNFLIQDLVTETPVPLVFNVRPSPASPNEIHGMAFKNWNVKMDMGAGYNNYIECSDPAEKFDGLEFDNFIFNGTKLTESNWITQGKFQIKNIETPVFK
jgi:hypothetical protein